MLPRRTFLAGALALGGSTAVQPLPFVHRAAEQRYTIAVPVLDFAAPDSGRPATDALQAAFDAAFETGLPLIFPRGEWVIERPLTIRNPERRHGGFPTLLGAGRGSTVLRALPFEGPMLSVRGAPDAALAGSFFLHGGRIEGIEFCGAGTFGQDGIETLGWWHGTIANCRFHRLGGNGLRAIGDPEHGQNPDFTASILTCEGCDFERLGGWGFLDDNPIGAPGWRFDHCIFNLCAGGGAFVRSSGHEYLGCTFAGCGFVDERTPAQTFGTGLRIGDAAGPAISRTRVVVAEFDANKDAHVVVDRVASLLVEDVRFIHHDRFGSGHPSPPLAVQLGTDALRSEVVQTRFLRPLFRLDTPGPVTGFRIASLARTHDLVIERGVWAQEFSGETGLVKFDGFPDPIAAKGQRIDAQEGR